VDDRHWDEARISWTPAEFLERISLWFCRAARGELHDPRQPLDPFFGASDYSFIFPRSALSGKNSTELAFFPSAADPRSLIGVPVERVKNADKAKIGRFTTVAYRVPHERMTRLRHAPSTFGSLVRALSSRGIDLIDDLRGRMKEWYGSKKTDAGRLASLLAIIVEFPVMTPDGKPTPFADREHSSPPASWATWAWQSGLSIRLPPIRARSLDMRRR
jgi:Prokaryotic E2 family A